MKGLEPEIQRMLQQHKIQLRQMDERYKEESSREKNLLQESFQRQIVRNLVLLLKIKFML